MSGRGRGFGRGGRSSYKGRGSGRTSYKKTSSNNDKTTNDKVEKVEFTPHYAGKRQGATYDTVKKQIIHDIRQKYKFGNDLAESLEKNEKHEDKDDPHEKLGFTPVTIKDTANPTSIEMIEYTEYVKEKMRDLESIRTTRRKHFL